MTDNSPVGYTCGTIDDAISSMESVRQANDELRGWGNEQFERAEMFEQEAANLQDQVDKLELELEELKLQQQETASITH